MAILTQTLVLALCCLGAYSFPNLPQEQKPTDGVFELLVSQMRTALMDTRSLTPAETVCASRYNNRTQGISDEMTTQTNSCFEKANATASNNIKIANNTITEMRLNLQKVQKNIANCISISDMPQFLDCTTDMFDSNLMQLDQTNTQAYQVQADAGVRQSEVNVVRQLCINAVIDSTKTNLTAAVNDYNICLGSVIRQRSLH